MYSSCVSVFVSFCFVYSAKLTFGQLYLLHIKSHHIIIIIIINTALINGQLKTMLNEQEDTYVIYINNHI